MKVLTTRRRCRLALSVRQPYAELILRRHKRWEYRGIRTNIRERVYIYASQKAGDARAFQKLRMKTGDLPTGVLVGTVEIAGCEGVPGNFRWRLKKPHRFVRRRKPTNHPQPVWFVPF